MTAPNDIAPPSDSAADSGSDHRLVVLLDEANRIMAEFDSVHAAHAARCNIECWLKNSREFGGDCVDWPNVEDSIRRLRILKATGRYPFEHNAEVRHGEPDASN
jgi:hypothetical protein